MLLYLTGLQTGEVLRLTTADVDLDATVLRVRETKFGKSRLVPGFVPFDRAGGELLFQLFSERYERRSTIVTITTNLAFSEWVQVFGDEKLQVFGDEKLTVALLDRLGYHAHVLPTSGTDRLRQIFLTSPFGISW